MGCAGERSTAAGRKRGEQSLAALDCRRAARVLAMVSDRLNALVRDEVERTYLPADDGYWADLVLAEFAFLEARSGRLDALAFHQKGDYIRYVGPWGRVTLEFAPDNYPGGPWIWGSVDLRSEHGAFRGELDRLVRERHRDTPLPSTSSLDRAAIDANVRAWAETLRAATDLF
jgi:hypothetical protein